MLAGEAADARPFFTPDSAELFGSSREDACFRWRIAGGDDAAVRLERVPSSSGRELVTVSRNTAEFWDIASGQRS